MRADDGTYALLLRAHDQKDIEIGALGEMEVRPGIYVYVGSAFGPGGLRARVERHVRGDGALHWHVDYLRAVMTLERVWYTYDSDRRECTWAETIHAFPGATEPYSGFGASDCNCSTHLFRFTEAPLRSDFQKRLRVQCPDHGPVSALNPTVRRESSDRT